MIFQSFFADVIALAVSLILALIVASLGVFLDRKFEQFFPPKNNEIGNGGIIALIIASCLAYGRQYLLPLPANDWPEVSVGFRIHRDLPLMDALIFILAFGFYCIASAFKARGRK